MPRRCTRDHSKGDVGGKPHCGLDAQERCQPEGAGTSITAPTKRQREGGLDWLEVRCHGQWQEEAWCELVAALDRARALAEDSGEYEAALEVGGQSLFVGPSGARLGDCHARWRVQWRGVEVLIVSRREFSDRRPSVVVKLSSHTLICVVDLAAWDRSVELLNSLGLEMRRDVVSRVDLCADLGGQSIAPFVAAFMEGRIVKRAQKRALYWESGDDPSGFTVGSDIKLRVYDKKREVEAAANGPKLGVLHARWGGDVTEATRVEFQLRRDALRERFGVEGVDSLWEKMRAIVRWLCGEWFRMTETKATHRNYSRVRLATEWRRVVKAFLSWAGKGAGELVAAVKKEPIPDKLIRQATGCLKTLAALYWDVGLTREEIFAFAIEMIEAPMCGGVEDVAKKRQWFTAAGWVPAGGRW